MVIHNDAKQLISLIDKETHKKVATSRDYVIKTESNDILMSFRWMDQSKVLIYTTPEETAVWTSSPVIQGIADGIEGTGPEELFEFLVAIATEDLRILDKLDDSVISFEKSIFNGKRLTQDIFHTLYAFRQEGWSERHYLERMVLLTDDLVKIDPYYSFIDSKYDKLLNHILRTQEYLDQMRQSYEAQIGIEQNNLMKFFTVITSIFLPLSLIAGWYGMNLMMPEVNWVYSYPFVIALCLAIVLIMIAIFRKNKWL